MTAVSASSARRKVGSLQKRKVSLFLQSSTSSAPHQQSLATGRPIITMKVFQDFISKLDRTEKHKSNFGYLCMKKRGSFPNKRFSFLLKSSVGGV